jgi:hypothetical protein
MKIFVLIFLAIAVYLLCRKNKEETALTEVANSNAALSPSVGNTFHTEVRPPVFSLLSSNSTYRKILKGFQP